MERSVPVKVVFEDEIFRINVDSISVIKLKASISEQIRRSLTDMILSYDDEEGDRIVITSDADLQTAYEELRVFKVRCQIRERPASAPSKSSTTKSDICSGTITRLAALRDSWKDGTKEREIAEELEMLALKISEGGKAGSETKGAIAEAISTLSGKIATAERRNEIAQAMRLYHKAETIALVFVVDATSSMGKHIKAVKTQISSIVEEMRTTNPQMKLHLGFIGYRDHSDASRFEVLPLSCDVSGFQEFVSSVQAEGGGDAPEDVHGALHRALQMEWDVGGSMTRVLVHIADAPCHGTKYHTLSGDSHPGGDPHGLKSAELLRGLRQLGVSYTFGRINESTDRMVRLFDEEAGGGYISECDMADCRAITKVVTTELRKSVCHTVEALLHGRAVAGASRHGPLASVLEDDEGGATGPRPYVIRGGVPAWGAVKALFATLYSNRPVESIEQLTRDRRRVVLWILPWGKAEPTDGKEAAEMEVKVASDPFAEGHCRLAYHGLLQGKPAVFKEFKSSSAKVNSLDNYMRQAEVAAIAHFLAKEYCRLRRPAVSIRFLPCHVAECCGAGATRRYNVESPLPAGEFVKFCNNLGSWDLDLAHPCLADFCKWTYEATGGYMMVADLQGVQTPDGFTLTDPAVLCEDVCRFGSTNMGPDGMRRMLEGMRPLLAA